MLDKKVNVIHDLSKGPYHFTNDTSFTANRFVWFVQNMQSTLGSSNLDAENNNYVFWSDDKLFSNPSSNYESFEVFNLNGQSVKAGKFDRHFIVHKAELTPGMYVIRFSNGTSEKFINQ